MTYIVCSIRFQTRTIKTMWEETSNVSMQVANKTKKRVDRLYHVSITTKKRFLSNRTWTNTSKETKREIRTMIKYLWCFVNMLCVCLDWYVVVFCACSGQTNGDEESLLVSEAVVTIFHVYTILIWLQCLDEWKIAHDNRKQSISNL